MTEFLRLGIRSPPSWTVKLVDLIGPAFDSLKILIEPFEDGFHGFICPLPIHVEVHAVF